VDKNAKKKLTKKYTTLTKRIGRVLKRFTPIDPADEYSTGDDWEDALPSIVSLLLRGRDRDELLKILAKARGEFDVSLDSVQDGKIADAVLKSADGGAPPRPKHVIHLDLRNDLEEIESYIVNRVRDFDPKLNHGPGESSAISQIVTSFECDQAGWVAMVFDTRPVPLPDGEWTLYLEDSPMLNRDHWIKAGTANFRGTITVVNIDGVQNTYSEENATFTVEIGEMIKRVVLNVRDRGEFSRLPIAQGCQIFVEDFNGEYFWPDCETPGLPNLVMP